MSNIYEIMLQTIHISAICVIILILKWLLADKLSPKWQYGVWSVIIISILIPYKLKTYIIPWLVVPFEVIKTNIEKGLDSSYIGVYEPLHADHIVPLVDKMPTSITDWLLVLYVLGILIYLLWHFVAYIKLRLTLKHGNPASNDYLNDVTNKYNLKECKVVEVEGLESAFICGVLNPVLAVPNGHKIDEKILLHELLHLKYKDPLQNVFWCVLKSLNWFNPFIHYVFNRIGNDMESLCDQRVLERLEGEERREYGNILLNMANNKYSRMAGTSSISNGGKNISRRIQSIVRFKLFPRGMAIVSVCTIIVLASTVLVNPTISYSESDYVPSPNRIDEAMAVTRVNRCTTVAGALDTYGKGIINKNLMYIATASPLDKQEELKEQMLSNVEREDELLRQQTGDYYNGNVINTYETDDIFDDIIESLSVINMYKVDEETYTAYLTFVTDYYDVEVVEGEESWVEQNRSSILLPVEVKKEDAWVVREIGKPIYLEGVDAIWNYAEFNYEGGATILRGQGKTGSVEVAINNVYEIDNSVNNGYISYGAYEPFDNSIKVDKEFRYAYNSIRVTYDSNNKTLEQMPENTVKICYMDLNDPSQEYQFPKTDIDYDEYYDTENVYGPCYTYSEIDDDWDGKVIGGDGQGVSNNMHFELSETPKAYVVRVYWDAQQMEDIIATEVQP